LVVTRPGRDIYTLYNLACKTNYRVYVLSFLRVEML